ncbi:thioesterase domain-containing protein [Aquabacterium sp. A7-Y]|uniref:thioesterase II family protein n=1 Tax=Aquabacterium sp. A7-Y TaxID=1349605 RepID=UPI00223D4544|nr:thioesterase domain-containing protein [Aquabacterium sp. A7-Y]MCW7541682.1 thioesterase domain-containing protein [Aquabacterium sp. A7-Y]
MSRVSGKDAGAREAMAQLFCFPHAGGSAASLNAWIRRLPATIALERVELPGRDPASAQRPYTRVPPLLPHLFPRLAARVDRPFALYGHSLGALVAFEFARWARREDYGAPLALFVSGRRAPQCPLALGALHGLPEPELMARLAEFGGTPEGVMRQSKWRDHLLPALRADLEMSDRYVYEPQPPLACPLYAFRGVADSIATEAEVGAWGAQTTGPFMMRTLPGAHFFSSEGIARLADVVVAELTRAACADAAAPDTRAVAPATV